jgi:Relaxase/Mobilisation nuclease domain
MVRQMIIKSMSRNNKSFEALYDYFTKEANSRVFGFNLYANPSDKKRVVEEFLRNAKPLHKARGKNFLFHEIISLRKSSLDRHLQEEILLKLANEYIDKRAKDHLVFSALHQDKEHLHIHLMISANKIMEYKRTRLSKAQFATIQKELESFQNTHFPELYSKHYDKSYSKENFHESRDEQEIKAKRKTASNKDKLKDELLKRFEQADSEQKLKEVLERDGIHLYTRGKNTGVEFEGKKYRFGTLGIANEYESMQSRLDRQNFRFRQAESNEAFDEFENER